MTNEEKQIDIITELLIDFDEMGFAPTTTVPNPEAYAIEWRKKITEELKCYRKASDVAREVIAEIEKIIDVDKFGEAKFNVRELYKIEKKYESEGGE